MLVTSYISAQNSYIIGVSLNTQSTTNFDKNENTINITTANQTSSTITIKNTLEYQNTTLNYKKNNFTRLNQLNNLKRVAYNFELEYQLYSKVKLVANVNPFIGFKTDLKFSNIDLLGGIAVEYLFNPNQHLILGIERNTFFGEIKIVPTVTFHHQVNQKLYYDVGFPSTKVSYSNNTRNQFRLITSLKGNSYILYEPRLFDTVISKSEVQFSTLSSLVEFERNIDSNWFLSFQGGYENNKKFEVIGTTTSQNFNNTQGYKLSLGIKYKL
ncbi:DUF6268 family outer membrane beta-barrel protein [Flavobacterium sp. 7A]|uniref:DUF6268 family outer membrane beta-barrel protein n=1 Tax=Flavobacterium sp. 7A TaxID=2940571 RepID=UPI002226DCDE|nr:DUF6268 family outer membrane beta-barrel protein [Flavobacterium sp. 7A]MCW2117844.1 hypothetical protein [Flavobacterium sp. 7A]